MIVVMVLVVVPPPCLSFLLYPFPLSQHGAVTHALIGYTTPLTHIGKREVWIPDLDHGLHHTWNSNPYSNPNSNHWNRTPNELEKELEERPCRPWGTAAYEGTG